MSDCHRDQLIPGSQQKHPWPLSEHLDRSPPTGRPRISWAVPSSWRCRLRLDWGEGRQVILGHVGVSPECLLHIHRPSNELSRAKPPACHSTLHDSTHFSPICWIQWLPTDGSVCGGPGGSPSRRGASPAVLSGGPPK